MAVELILLLASLVITWLVFTWAVQVLKVSINTAIAIAFLVLILQLAFGIAPQELLQEIKQLPQTVLNLVRNQ